MTSQEVSWEEYISREGKNRLTQGSVLGQCRCLHLGKSRLRETLSFPKENGKNEQSAKCNEGIFCNIYTGNGRI